MKRAICISAAACVVVAALAAPRSAAADDKSWIVGHIAPLSGPAATVGVRAYHAVEMWVDRVNGQGGIKGRKIDLINCNDENKPEKAVACARDMIQKGAVIIIGNALTSSLFAIQPLVKEGPTLIIGSPNVVPAADTYAFQVSPSDHGITEAVANYMKANGLSKLGMIAATDASGEVGVTSAKAVFPKAGIDLKLARIDLKATDASTQLVSVAGDDVPLVYSSYTGGGAIAVVKSFSNLGLKQPLVVSYGNISAAFAGLVKDSKPPRLLGTSLKSLLPAELKDAGEKERAAAFIKDYQAKHNETPDLLNLIGKLGADTADSILRKSPDPADFKATKAWLEKTPIESVHTIRFSPTSHVGLSADAITMVELKNGVWGQADPIKK